ncbi:E3 ubiquitin-protein ligase RNF14, partial [Lecanoromycetidae sp. Uapishka_2]
MAGDIGGDEGEDERALELETVAAIYPELRTDLAGLGPFSASIDVAVEPLVPIHIRFPEADGVPPPGQLTPPDSTNEGEQDLEPVVEGERTVHSGNSNSTGQQTHRLAHLPPLTLDILLPDGYPTTKPPIFHVSSTWLPVQNLQRLQEASHSIWEEMGRDQVVFSYIDHLREAAEQGFGLGQNEENVLEVPLDLKVVLLDFDLKARRAKFEQETFECGICLEPKKGAVCHRLDLCSHVFCIECLQDFYNSLISEGDVGNVKCMAPDCGAVSKNQDQEDKTLEPSELLQIPLGQEMVQRYIKLKRKKRLESDRSTVWCPRAWCLGPCRCPNKKQDSPPLDDEAQVNSDKLPPPAERLAICEDCAFAFCKVCKASWHGEYFVCFPRNRFELTAEEKASEEYMMLHTQPCPTCDARAQKTHGCNHMICFKCDTHFCYLCGRYLDKGNPYQHYNTNKSSCYMRLWELEGGDDGDIGLGFDGGAHVDSDDDDDTDDGEDGPGPLWELPPVVQAPPAVPPNQAPAQPAHARGANIAHRLNDRAPANAQRRRVARGPGLQRALQMIENDEEDDWDSDEMEEADEELFNWN